MMTYPWHQTQKQQLMQAHQQERLPHALLFNALKGCGHKSFMHAMAQNLLCLNPDSQGNACQQCRSCHVFHANAHPDFIIIQAQENKQEISINQIRDLTQFLTLSRSYSNCRVALILQAERMNINAANSLLKSLEEPIDNTYLLLYSTQISQLLATILSRCQQIRLPSPPATQSLEWLGTQTLSKNADFLLQQAMGKPLLALEMDSNDTLAKQQEFLKELSALAHGRKTITEISLKWEKESAVFLLDCQLQWLWKLISQHLQSSSLNPTELTTNSDHHKASSLPQNIHTLWSIYDRLLALKQLATHPLNPRLFIENMLALWPKLLLKRVT